jgi:hypothetical protein
LSTKATRAVLKRAKDDRAASSAWSSANRGGFDVLIYGLRAFCPVSGMASR